MSTPYQKYIKNFSKLHRNKLQRIVDSKPKYPSPFLPRRNLYDKAAENSLKSRNMNRSRHNLPEFLIDKNKAYGNSALDPVRVFSKANNTEQLKVRIDDKLSRFARGNEFPGDNDIDDLLGYLVLLKVAVQNDWRN
jgi:hypothetical protein